jgi:hypothetical protein
MPRSALSWLVDHQTRQHDLAIGNVVVDALGEQIFKSRLGICSYPLFHDLRRLTRKAPAGPSPRTARFRYAPGRSRSSSRGCRHHINYGRSTQSRVGRTRCSNQCHNRTRLTRQLRFGDGAAWDRGYFLRQFGYSTPAEYPAFYWNSVSMHLDEGVKLLNLTVAGRQRIANLHHHIHCAEHSNRMMGRQR